MTTVLDEILNRFKALPADKQAELKAIALKDSETRLWVPTPGPQLDAYNCTADILLFGGSAGSSKTDLLLGLAFTKHKNSLILRRQYTDLSAITERAIAINRTRKGFNGSIPPKIKTQDGRHIEFGACQRIGDETNFQGRPHSLLAVDEAVQFAESQIRFLITWVRSVDPNERCRIVMASNPPVGADGEWIIAFFAPWLDPTYHNPAKPGELRWYVTDEDNKDREVPDGTPVKIGGRMVKPMSRTFIPGKLADNPFLSRTDYGAKLDALPEPYRSAFRDGNFMLARKDAEQQVIPTQWVREAQARWTPNPPPGVPMCAIGVDPSGGGADADEYILSPRHDAWFAPLISAPNIKTGQQGAGVVISYRRDNATVIIDMGGGYGGSTYDHLKQTLPADWMGQSPVVAHKGAESSNARTVDGLLGFFNVRSQVYWQFREALDPSQPGGSPVALPPDPMMVADLTAATFEVTARGIKIEPKDDVKKKLGRSPDRGDGVVISWSSGQKAITHAAIWGRAQGNVLRLPTVIRHRAAQREFVRR